MSSVAYAGRSLELSLGESVLDGLLRSGIPVAHACKAGSCGSCMLRAVGGCVPPRAQVGLKDSWKAQGYFLSCVCVPEADMEVSEAGADTRVAARIMAVDHLSHDVLRVRLEPERHFDYRAGQYLTLIRDTGLARSYSIASLPHESELELHVRLIPGGRMSTWLCEPASVGAQVQLQGPTGECFYVPDREDQPLLLAGTGTGLAPLWGIIQDALRRNHRGPIHLFHGALRMEGLYLREALRALAARYANFTYTAAVLEGAEEPGIFIGPIDAVIASSHPKLNGWRGFICGDPTLVRSLKRKLFLAGIAMGDIYSDAFLPSA